MLISHGVEVIPPDRAGAMGYRAYDAAILPRMPVPATTDEARKCVASDQTVFPMQLVRVPKGVVEALCKTLQRLPREGGLPNPTPQEAIPGLPEFKATPLLLRHDDSNAWTASVDPQTINPRTNRPSFVGLHIDVWPDPQILYGMFNLGPGVRYHGISSDITRAHVGPLKPRERQRAVFEYLKQHNPGDVTVNWFRLDPPGYDEQGNPYMEALLGSPVAYALHDGLIWVDRWKPSFNGIEALGSTALATSIEMPEVGLFPSALTPELVRYELELPVAA